MKRLDDIRTVFFVGIGGIGMSALARYFLSRGCRVRGYDRTATGLTRELAGLGMEVIHADDPGLAGLDHDLVVYTPAIPAHNRILTALQAAGQPLLKRSEVLGLVCEGNTNVCIAGTHGKTTISAMTAHILRHSGYGCNAFLGGIASNYGTNFWSHERRLAVIEADEYDRSFFRLSPDIAVISAMDPDHLDIYHSPEAFREAFQAFARRVRTGGQLIVQHRLSGFQGLPASVSTYDLSAAAADIHAEGLVPRDGTYRYDVQAWGRRLGGFMLPMGGRHNVENSLAAIAVALRLGLSEAAVRAALADFRGVRRRFEFHLRLPGRAYIDDYAHHPEELRALIGGVRDLYPDSRITLVFQPHLFSRTRDFAAGFAESLDGADEVLLLPVYPAREQPIAGVEARLISAAMRRGAVHVADGADVLRWLEAHPPEVLVTAGAGDIDRLVEPIREHLNKRSHG